MHLEAEVYIFCVSYVSNFHILVIKSMYGEKLNGKYHFKNTVYAHCCFVVCFIKGTISQDFQYFFNLTFKSVRKILNQSLKIRITNFFTQQISINYFLHNKFIFIIFRTTKFYSLLFCTTNFFSFLFRTTKFGIITFLYTKVIVNFFCVRKIYEE